MKGYWFNLSADSEIEIPETTGDYGLPNHQYWLEFRGMNGSSVATVLGTSGEWLLPDGTLYQGSANMNIVVSWSSIPVPVDMTQDEAHQRYFAYLNQNLDKFTGSALAKFNKHYQTGKSGIKGYKRKGIAKLWDEMQPVVNLQAPYASGILPANGYIQIDFAPRVDIEFPYGVQLSLSYTTSSKTFETIGVSDGLTDYVYYTIARLTVI